MNLCILLKGVLALKQKLLDFNSIDSIDTIIYLMITILMSISSFSTRCFCFWLFLIKFIFPAESVDKDGQV